MLFFRKLFNRQSWKLVKILKDPDGIVYRPPEKEPVEGDIFYNLFESNKGNRRVKIGCTIVKLNKYGMEQFAESTTMYHTQIYRWLAGRNDPEIPSYNEIDEEETADYLRGSSIHP